MSHTEYKHKVAVTEYELGWGSRPLSEHLFDTEEDAKTYVKTYNAQNNLSYVPEWYCSAEYVGIVQVKQ